MNKTRGLIMGLFCLLAVRMAAQDKERPNIIFIMSDDHARQAMSVYGHPIGKIAPTPNIDRIGEEGACSIIIIVAILFPGRAVRRY